ncbi:MAG: hypothetical protein DHS20C16_22220 [Phycisphaerae bacterium]|nr:MAG: hypothetical protein DHS20C16_22220 [Phycisphaerae bacterium]
MNQNDDQKLDQELSLAAEVEQLEKWFAECSKQYPEPASRVIEHAKMRANVEAGEQNLSEAANGSASFGVAKTVPPCAKTIVATKSAVRRELVELAVTGGDDAGSTGDVPARKVPMWGALMTLASAAMIAVVVLPSLLKSTEPQNAVGVSALDDWAYILTDSTGFDFGTDSDFDSDIEGFESDLNDLGDALVSLPDITDELGTEDIEDAIDQLYSDSASLLDS